MNIMIPAIGMDRGFAAMGGGETLPILFLLVVGTLSLSVSALLLLRRPSPKTVPVYHNHPE